MMDKDRFFAAQSGLDARIRIASGQPFVSLREGLPRDWEGYKQLVRPIARDRLGPEKWSQSAIGDGRILKATIQAIEIEESRDIRNNMVSFQARWGDGSRAHHRLCAARADRVATERIERALFTFYRVSPEDEPGAYEALESAAGRRFPSPRRI